MSEKNGLPTPFKLRGSICKDDLQGFWGVSFPFLPLFCSFHKVSKVILLVCTSNKYFGTEAIVCNGILDASNGGAGSRHHPVQSRAYADICSHDPVMPSSPASHLNTRGALIPGPLALCVIYKPVPIICVLSTPKAPTGPWYVR